MICWQHCVMKIRVVSLLFAACCLHAAPYVATFDPLTLQMTGGFAVPSVPNSIAFGGTTLLTASDSGLQQYTPAGSLVTSFFAGGQFTFNSLTYSGDLYGVVTSFGNTSVQRLFNLVNGGFSGETIAGLTSVPNSIARVGTSTYAAFDNALSQFNAAGTNVATFTAGSLFGFRGLAYNGSLYVGVDQLGSSSIAALLALQNGGFTAQSIVGLSTLPMALAASADSIYAVFSDGLINRYDLSGNLLASAQPVGASWTSVTLGRGELFVSGDVATPEPATVAVVAVSLGLILARRRIQRAFSRTCTCS